MGTALAVLGLVESWECMAGAADLLLDLPGIQFLFSLSSFFVLSSWATDTLFCPCPFVQNLANGSRVCAI